MGCWDAKMPALEDAAKAVALEVVDRINTQSEACGQEHFDLSLAGGASGLALVLGYLDRCSPADGWDKAAHRAVIRIGQSLALSSPMLPVGLFGGLAGVAFTLQYLSRDETRYRRALTAVEDVLFPRAMALAASVAHKHGLPVEDYDLVSGLSGVAAYLSCRTANDRALSTLSAIVEALVELVERNEQPPAWHTPADQISTRSMIGKYPAGNLNCGLAHGAPGLLAVLAVTRRAGLSAAHHDAAMERLAQWLLGQCEMRHWGRSWPAAVGVRPTDAATRPPSVGATVIPVSRVLCG